MPSLPSWIFQGTLVSTLAATATFFVYTKHCHFEPVKATDSIFKSPFYAKFNPQKNAALHDLCVRKIPLFKVRRDLIDDAEKGGSRLVERFAGGVWGNVGCAIQRKYLAQKYRKDPSTHHMLWDKEELRESSYEEGTDLLNHFSVLSKSPTSIIFRCGDSPLTSRDAPRASDGLFEITARVNMDRGFAEFELRSLFYQGEGVAKASLEEDRKFVFAHQMYTKLLMETGIKNCML